jgi:hypothetical protein
MQMKRMLIVALLCLVISSCTSSQEIFANAPQITATAVEFDSSSKDIAQVIDKGFGVATCSKKDLLNDENVYHYSVDNPLLVEISKESLEKVKVKEIADNKSGSYRAYLVDEPSPDVCESCDLSRIYIEDKVNNIFSKMDWKDYVFTRYLSNIVWIGDDVLAMRQDNDSNIFELYGVDVRSKDFVYFSVISCK